jgi:hypothetical protein
VESFSINSRIVKELFEGGLGSIIPIIGEWFVEHKIVELHILELRLLG